jgi:hypothetical protein
MRMRSRLRLSVRHEAENSQIYPRYAVANGGSVLTTDLGCPIRPDFLYAVMGKARGWWL